MAAPPACRGKTDPCTPLSASCEPLPRLRWGDRTEEGDADRQVPHLYMFMHPGLCFCRRIWVGVGGCG
eukprot:CAMPEP_0185438328 /NCGR_PEP_ID=MMETSP1365-20130426/34242_1 /TAXON_ID=38817 /ORGANISM="Gephyrocapsa oceanica, Strain RCC1303" /LENGTH=67 /DNA_ID=CAMNT_0028043503 /DNA_START=59 /DNA_END=259 /DNA_ORIENTATION=-